VARNRFRLGCILVPIGLLVVPIAGTWLFMKVLASALHPDPQAIPSVTRTEPSPQWSEAVNRVRRSIRASLDEQNLPGLSVAVGVGGSMVWAEGFGWAHIETRMPVTPDTRFRIGTASTALTSATAGVLLEKGRLRLDDEIQTYVSQFPKKQWSVTLRQLMAHVGGVGTDGGDEGPLFPHRCERPVEALEHFAQGELLFEPGTQYRHSKYGWILVSAAVEAAAAQPFLTFMRERIFRPLGMDQTGAESATEENPERVGEPAEDAPFLTLTHQLILKPLGMSGTKARPATEPATAYAPGWGPDPQVRYGRCGGPSPDRNPSSARTSVAVTSGVIAPWPAAAACRRGSPDRSAPGRTGWRGMPWTPHSRTGCAVWAGTSAPSRWQVNPRRRPASTASCRARGWGR